MSSFYTECSNLGEITQYPLWILDASTVGIATTNKKHKYPCRTEDESKDNTRITQKVFELEII